MAKVYQCDYCKDNLTGEPKSKDYFAEESGSDGFLIRSETGVEHHFCGDYCYSLWSTYRSLFSWAEATISDCNCFKNRKLAQPDWSAEDQLISAQAFFDIIENRTKLMIRSLKELKEEACQVVY
jgi:hypothetical protein